MIFVTGGAGFIGSNFVLDWLAQGDEPVLNFDKLTYAGNLSTARSACWKPCARTGALCLSADVKLPTPIVPASSILWSNYSGRRKSRPHMFTICL